MILHLGVDDVPYAAPAKTPRRVSTKRRQGGHGKWSESTALSSPAAGAETTYDVAMHLEDQYHIMELFFEENQEAIANDLAESVSGKIEDMFMGAPVEGDPFGAGVEGIKQKFHDFLSLRHIETLGIPGVPTKAAERGVNHRLLHPYAKGNPPRPSFIDTGLYEASFQAWVE